MTVRYGTSALGVSLKAKYGIDLKELRFKYMPESDELIVANINPRFLSFGNRSWNGSFSRRWSTGDSFL